MTVRGTTAWNHARLMRKIINHDSGTGRHIICSWDTCENDGFELYKVRVNTAQEGYEKRYMHYVFCSERHKQYWLENVRPGSNNNLPPGLRHSL